MQRGRELNDEYADQEISGSNLLERWRIFRNTRLNLPTWFFRTVVRNSVYDSILNDPLRPTRSGLGRIRNIKRRARRLLLAIVWFWPRASDANLWAQADFTSNWSPELYLRSEPRRLLKMVMDQTPKNAAILDLGCNSGADLNILALSGWRNLSGVDAGRAALELFSEQFPDTYALADIKRDLFQRYLIQTPNLEFDVVYSNGSTIELVHSSFPIVKELCRVTRNSIFIDIFERGEPYPRDYLYQFKQAGFVLTEAIRPRDLKADMSLLKFNRAL